MDGPILLAGFPGSMIFYALDLPLLCDSIWVLVVLEPALLNAGLYFGIRHLGSRKRKPGVSD